MVIIHIALIVTNKQASAAVDLVLPHVDREAVSASSHAQKKNSQIHGSMLSIVFKLIRLEIIYIGIIHTLESQHVEARRSLKRCFHDFYVHI